MHGYQYELENTVVYSTGPVVTAGVLVNFAMGARVGASFSWSHGSSTSYTGGVGIVATGEDFNTRSYGYGMFTYVHEDPASSQPFEVVDCWVE